ncbi:hypothetical protein Pelo_6529 [Pelomyxa schiedti]|nr:hypothetical protein Pelo_6529 [Pelomyxa schiedti]
MFPCRQNISRRYDGIENAAYVYQQKLVQLKRDMYTVTERTDRVKQRALKLQQRRLQLRAEEESKIRKQLEQERSLMAVDATEATAAQSHSHHTLSPPSSSVVTVGSMTPVVSPLPSTTSTSSS